MKDFLDSDYIPGDSIDVKEAWKAHIAVYLLFYLFALHNANYKSSYFQLIHRKSDEALLKWIEANLKKHHYAYFRKFLSKPKKEWVYEKKELRNFLLWAFRDYRKKAMANDLMQFVYVKDTIRLMREYLFAPKPEAIEDYGQALIDLMAKYKEHFAFWKDLYLMTKGKVFPKPVASDAEGETKDKAAVAKKEKKKEFLPPKIDPSLKWEHYKEITRKGKNFLVSIFWWLAWMDETEGKEDIREYLKRHGVHEREFAMASAGTVFWDFVSETRIQKRYSPELYELIHKVFEVIAPPKTLSKEAMDFIFGLGIYKDNPKMAEKLAGFLSGNTELKPYHVERFTWKDIRDNAFVRAVIRTQKYFKVFDLFPAGSRELTEAIKLFPNAKEMPQTAQKPLMLHLIRLKDDDLLDLLKWFYANDMDISNIIQELLKYTHRERVVDELKRVGIVKSTGTSDLDRFRNLNFKSPNVRREMEVNFGDYDFIFKSFDYVFGKNEADKKAFVGMIGQWFYDAPNVTLRAKLESLLLMVKYNYKFRTDRATVRSLMYDGYDTGLKDLCNQIVDALVKKRDFDTIGEYVYLTAENAKKLLGSVSFLEFLKMYKIWGELANAFDGSVYEMPVKIGRNNRFEMSWIYKIANSDKRVAADNFKLRIEIDPDVNTKDLLVYLNNLVSIPWNRATDASLFKAYSLVYEDLKKYVKEENERLAQFPEEQRAKMARIYKRSYFEYHFSDKVLKRLENFPSTYKLYYEMYEFAVEEDVLNISPSSPDSYSVITIKKTIPNLILDFVAKWEEQPKFRKAALIGAAFSRIPVVAREAGKEYEERIPFYLNPLLARMKKADVKDVMKIPEFYNYVAEHVDEPGFLDQFTLTAHKESEILQVFASNDLFLRLIEEYRKDQTEETLIPLPRFFSDRDIVEALRYNDYSFNLASFKRKKGESIRDYLKRLKESDVKLKEKIPDAEVEEIKMSKRELEKYSAKLLKYYHTYHTRTGILVLKRFKVKRRRPRLFLSYKKVGGYYKLRFHGTSYIGAAMILRFGFADPNLRSSIRSSAIKTVGDMLARNCVYYSIKGKHDWKFLPSFKKHLWETKNRRYDFKEATAAGVYSAKVISKAAQYARNRRFYAEIGDKGYIFLMEVAYGKRGWDHKAAGLPNAMPEIRTPEWAVYDANNQYIIKEVLFVQHVPIQQIQKLARKYGYDDKIPTELWIDEAKKNEPEVFTMTFYTDKIVLPDGSVEDVDEAFEWYRKHGAVVKSGPNASYEVVFRTNARLKSYHLFIPSAYEMVNKSDLMGMLKKAWGERVKEVL